METRPFSALAPVGAIAAGLLPQIANATLLVHFPFDGNATDATGNTGDATLNNGAIVNPAGRFGGALDVTAANAGGAPAGGASNAVVAGGTHLDSAFANNAMAVSFHQFNNNIQASSSFWVHSPGAGANDRGFQAHTPWSNGTVFFDQSGCCNPPQRLTVEGVITLSQWQHFVFQRDAAGTMEIWVDGVQAATSAGVEDLDPFSGIVTIGANGGGANNLTGRIDEFAIYAGTLTPAEIGELAGGNSVPTDIATPPDDADNDGLPDAWEIAFGLSPNDDGSVDINNGPDGDPDSDGLTNAEELDGGLEPDNDDFDNDGLLDGVETNTGVYVDETDTGTDSKNDDSDGDGLLDGVEDPSETFVDANQPGTDPTNSDTDGDNFDDLTEINFGSDPTDSESVLGSDELTLLAYYNFDGQSLDQTGNSPEAVIGGTAVLTTGGMGFSGVAGDESLDLGVVNDGGHAQTAPGPHLDQAFLNNAMSVTFWQFRTQDGSTSAFWIHSPTAGANQRGFQAHTPWSNGTIFFDQSGCCNPPQRLTTIGSSLNEWEHFVFQRDGTGMREIWINGVLAASAPDGEPLDPFDGIITIGAEGPNLANSFGGRIDDFAIFSAPLTPEQIMELAQGANPSDLLSPPVPLEITTFNYDPETGTAEITWNSRPNQMYALDVADDLNIWSEVDDSIDSQGDQTTYTVPPIFEGPRQFFRVRELN